MKSVDHIDIIFENCDLIENINHENIGYFNIEKIRPVVQRWACNCIDKNLMADKVEIELKKEVDHIHYDFGMVNDESSKTTVFKRIQDYRDITHIDVFYDDGTNEYYNVDYMESWNGWLGTPNINHKNWIDENGSLWIKIEKANWFKIKWIRTKYWLIGQWYRLKSKFKNKFKKGK